METKLLCIKEVPEKDFVCFSVTVGKIYVNKNYQDEDLYIIIDDKKESRYYEKNFFIELSVLKSQLIRLIKTHILQYNQPNGSMQQFEIDGFAYDVDYTSTIHRKEGMKSGDYDTPNDNDTLTVELHTIDIRNVWDESGEMLPAEQLKELNKEFYIL